MRLMRCASVLLAAVVAHGLLLVVPSSAQERTMHHADGFDPDRAILGDAPMFDPFHVTTTEPLREALRDRVVAEDTPLLVIERAGGTVAVITYQMAYHHVAQGELAGEPWLVAF